jgi:hypothetical protein
MTEVGKRSGKTYQARMELKEKIRKAQEELKTAGPIHSRDLRKHIRRMQNQLRIYDRYHRGVA